MLAMFVYYLFSALHSHSLRLRLRFLSRIKTSDSSFSPFIVIFALLSAQLVQPRSMTQRQRHVMCNLTRAPAKVSNEFLVPLIYHFQPSVPYINRTNAMQESNENKQNNFRYFLVQRHCPFFCLHLRLVPRPFTRSRVRTRIHTYADMRSDFSRIQIEKYLPSTTKNTSNLCRSTASVVPKKM